MKTEHIKLGMVGDEFCFLSKHAWHCDWYWGFGYVGNNKHHYHIESMIGAETDVDKIFSSTRLTQNAWWITRDLFIQAYALKKASEVYRYAGYQIVETGITDVLKCQEKADHLNADLAIILDKVWDFLDNELNKEVAEPAQ